MDETPLRRLLGSVLADEPPVKPVAQNVLREGIKHRRRRRVLGAAGSVAVVAAIAIAVPAVTGPLGSRPVSRAGKFTVYVRSIRAGTVTPITVGATTPEQPIRVGQGSGAMAITPNGKTIYVADYGGMVTPIATATNTPGKPIKVGKVPVAIAITPDGKTAYVANVFSGTVTPIATATNTPGKPIKVGRDPLRIAITPDGETAYVLNAASGTVTPIATATNTPGKPINVGRDPFAVAITPDGKTAYVVCGNTVTPIATATNTPGKPIKVRGNAIAITPDGKTAYVDQRRPGGGVQNLQHGDADRDRHQHARQTDQARRPTHSAAGHTRLPSPPTGRPPTSPASAQTR